MVDVNCSDHAAFIQDVEHRPKLGGAAGGDGSSIIIEAEGIPVIDLSRIDEEEEDEEEVKGSIMVAEIGDACKKWGFFQVINHGVPLACREKIDSASRNFFAHATEDEKRRVRREELKPMGYHDSEFTKNVRDWKQIFDFAVESPTVLPTSYGLPSATDEDHHDHDHNHNHIISTTDQMNVLVNQWPDYPPNFREACEEYAGEVEKLCHKLLGLISMSLGLGADRLRGYFRNQTSLVRLNHYPPCPIPHLALGLGRHKDGDALTVLSQDDVGGLEVKRKSDGEWVRVKPTPNSFIINLGDVFQVWSNDRYESVEHRVSVNSDKERFSIGFFFIPAHYVELEPLAELVDHDQNPARYRAFNWGKFLSTKLFGNFKKLNVQDLQISHFRIPN